MAKRKKKIGVSFLIVVILAAAGVFLARLMSQPANGTVVVPASSAVASKPGIKTLTSAYFSTRYSGRYQLLPAGNTQSASLAYWTLVAHQEAAVGESSKLSLTITTLPAGGVTEDSAYKLYHAHPELYKLSAATYNHDPVIVAVRQDSSYQQTILWPHGQYLFTASLTAASQTELVDSELQTVLSNLHWRQ